MLDSIYSSYEKSYKIDLDFWDCFGRETSPSNKKRIMVGTCSI